MATNNQLDTANIKVSVAEGGTGGSSFTAYSVITGGTTSTGALQNVSGVGTSTQVLTSNGASALPTWQAAGGGAGATRIIIQISTGVGTTSYVPTSGMLYCIIEAVGGGGAGGGTGSASSSTPAGAGGGGSGSYGRVVASAATIGASKVVAVGAGGTASSNANGGVGGVTTVGTAGAILATTGGLGGIKNSTGGSYTAVKGGAGGAAGTNGALNANGQNGFPGQGLFLTGGTAKATSGQGGNSFFAGGAPSVIAAASLVGVAGTFGSGGSGAASINGTSRAGGAGGVGFIIITELCT